MSIVNKIYLGILSGTSIDSIDIIAVDFNNNYKNNFKIIANSEYPIPEDIKHIYFKIIENNNFTITEYIKLNNIFGHLFADCINNFLEKYNNIININNIAAIGVHGQTIYHAPNGKYPYSIQVACPNIIKSKTNLTIISDFRNSDIAAGGQGAPLAPIIHKELFFNKNINRIIINIGGISNISILDSNGSVIGYDTGPGNCLIDEYCKLKFNIDYDKNGEIALSGNINQDLLSNLLNLDYFNLNYPKSTGRDIFNINNIKYILDKYKISNNDILSTLTALTAKTIANEIQNYFNNKNNFEIYLAGGGAFNKAIISYLNNYLNINIYTTDKLNISPKLIESLLFAYLAKQCINKKPSNTKNITGSKINPILGCVYN